MTTSTVENLPQIFILFMLPVVVECVCVCVRMLFCLFVYRPICACVCAFMYFLLLSVKI